MALNPNVKLASTARRCLAAPRRATGYQDDPTLPVGQRRQVEVAREGMNIEMYRVIKRGDQVLSRERFVSEYVPTQATFKVGKKTNPYLSVQPALHTTATAALVPVLCCLMEGCMTETTLHSPQSDGILPRLGRYMWAIGIVSALLGVLGVGFVLGQRLTPSESDVVEIAHAPLE